MNAGTIVETGNHVSLMAKKGLYYEMVLRHDNKPVEEITSTSADVSEKISENCIVPTISSAYRGERTSSFTFEHKQKSTDVIKLKAPELGDMGSFASDKDVSTEDVSTVKKNNNDIDIPVDVNLTKWLRDFSIHERGWLIIAIVCSVLAAGVWPVFNIILSSLMNIVLGPDNIEFSVRWWALGFIFLAIFNVLVEVFRIISVTKINGALRSRLRNHVYRRMLDQPMSWFEDPQHTASNLCTILGEDCTRFHLFLH